MATPLSDTELMLRVKAGGREAFGLLVQKHRKPLINFIYRFITNSRDPEDLAQDVFIKVYQSASTYEAKAAFTTWLYRIATNRVLNFIRDHRVKSTHSKDEELDESGNKIHLDFPDQQSLVEARLLEEEKKTKIHQALASLPENQRLAVILTKYQELSLKETAAVMKCSELAAKSLIYRAYTSLRDKLVEVAEVRS
jgi:RNA polymerase sigma-70 factor (ECF subfamily)